MSKCALLCACGIAATVFAADGVNTGLPVESSFRTGAKQPVQKSDVVVAGIPSQRDIDSDAAMNARKAEAVAQQLARLSTRAAFAPAATPNFFYFNNIAIPLNLKPQMALLVNGTDNDQKRAIAVQALANAGIAITPDVSKISRFVIVNLPQGVQSTDEMRVMLDRVLATGLVSFAAPVFDSEAMEGGFRIPTPEILIRANVAGARDAAIPGAVHVLHEQIGPSAGVSQLQSASRNGFDVMAQANMMQSAAGIRWAHVDFLESLKQLHVPDDPLFGDQWQLQQANDIDMDAELAWDFCLGSSSVVTAVMDSGHQLNHPDLNAITGRDFTTGAVNGTGTGAPVDACDNHGTCVAGCISARIDNGLGVAGGAPGTTTMPERVSELQPANCHFFSAYQSSWNINALNYALNQGAKVTNSSYQVGFSQATSDAYSDTGDTMVHCAASGNDGVEGIVFPSSAPLVISCGGFYSSGTRYGNWGTGLDVCAPSVSVYSTDRTGSNGYVNGDYCTVTGTSFASPLTASVAALFRSEFPFATASQTRTSVYGGCVDVGAAGYDTDYGYGRINLYRTLLDRANSNYDCSHATTIPAAVGAYNPAVYSTTFALNKTEEPFESCEVGAAGVSSCVYYKFTPPYTGLMDINTNGSDYDTVLSVFESCTGLFGTNPTQLACDDDGGTGTQSQLTDVPVTYGNQVIIKVAKYGMSAGGGNLDFNFQFTAVPPANDSCGNAINIPVSGLTYSYNSPVVDSQLATISACENDETCGAASNGHSVWFKFTAPQTGVVNIDTLNSDYDTVLSVFPECSFTLSGNCIRYTQMACNDDSNGGLQSEINNINVVAGADYLIKVSSYNTTAGGGCRLHLTYTMSPPSNDDCADATTIPTANTAIQWSSPLINARAATVQSCESTETCGLNNGKSIWWEFTPPRDGHMNLNTVGSTYDTVLSIYTACARLVGTSCSQATLRGCNDDDTAAGVLTSRMTNFAVTGGLTYRFKVGAYNDNAAGDAKLNIQWTADCPADWNNDHSVDFFDYLDFLQAFNSAGLAGDFNDDAVVDFFDYLDFVQAFSHGC